MRVGRGHNLKSLMIRSGETSLGLGFVLWNDLRNGKAM